MQPHSTPPTSPTLFNILWHNDNLFGCYLCFSKDGFNFNRAIIACEFACEFRFFSLDSSIVFLAFKL